MTSFDPKYFTKFNFDEKHIKKHLNNSLRDLEIAKKDKILDVKFNYTYSAFLKAGIALLSHNQLKAKNMPGHHIRIIEMLAHFLKDDSIADIGNVIRAKRNIDLYAGGTEITEKECDEYLSFVEKTIKQVKEIIISGKN